MKRWIDRWDAYWFPQESPLYLSMARIMVVGMQLLFFLPDLDKHFDLLDKNPRLHRSAGRSSAPSPGSSRASDYFTHANFTVLYWVLVVGGHSRPDRPLYPAVDIRVRPAQWHLRRARVLLRRPAPYRGDLDHLHHVPGLLAVEREAVGRRAAASASRARHGSAATAGHRGQRDVAAQVRARPPVHDLFLHRARANSLRRVVSCG